MWKKTGRREWINTTLEWLEVRHPLRNLLDEEAPNQTGAIFLHSCWGHLSLSAPLTTSVCPTEDAIINRASLHFPALFTMSLCYLAPLLTLHNLPAPLRTFLCPLFSLCCRLSFVALCAILSLKLCFCKFLFSFLMSIVHVDGFHCFGLFVQSIIKYLHLLCLRVLFPMFFTAIKRMNSEIC